MNLSNMKVTAQSLYHQPGGEAVLAKVVEYFYNFLENLPWVKSVREKYEATTHARKYRCGLVKP
jgi:truncated hemoglobin YjbI